MKRDKNAVNHTVGGVLVAMCVRALTESRESALPRLEVRDCAAQTFAKGNLRLITQKAPRFANVSQRVFYITRLGLRVADMRYDLHNLAERDHQLVQCERLATGHVADFTTGSQCSHRLEVRLHDVIHIDKITRLLPVTKYGDLTIFQQGSDEAWNYCGIGRERVLSRAERSEERFSRNAETD